MARVKRGVTARRRHKAVLKAVKGHRQSRSRRFRVAKEALIHAMDYATRHRRLKKRTMRSLAILRINAAVRSHGLTYHKLQYGLNVAGININRNQLADLSISEPQAFAAIVEQAKAGATSS